MSEEYRLQSEFKSCYLDSTGNGLLSLEARNGKPQPILTRPIL